MRIPSRPRQAAYCWCWLCFWLSLALATAILFGQFGGSSALAQGTIAGSAGAAQTSGANPPRDYSSRNFVLHTDLSADEAKELLARLETMLGLISRYWGRPSSGVIECYVVKNLSNWPPSALRPEGLSQIQAGAGVTIGQKITSGNQFIAKSVVYAVADHGTPQHEAVHAYCQQTFGSSGPTWYSEGMAEMGQYWKTGELAVNIDPDVLKYIQSSKPKTLAEIVAAGQVTGDSWQAYAWRWALCHLLANNPNYSRRFQPLGVGLMSGQPVSFEAVYGAMANEISFEYLFFLQHLQQGYRADLAAWDWEKKFLPLAAGNSRIVSAFALANRGWQPTGLSVDPSSTYEYSAEGKWKTSTDSALVDADGSADKTGRLEGAVLSSEYQLSEPFDLGSYGALKPPSAGNLYVRCRDGWDSLADNTGRMSVKLKLQGAGAPLPKPAGK